jgi:hypothetical protein
VGRVAVWFLRTMACMTLLLDWLRHDIFYESLMSY